MPRSSSTGLMWNSPWASPWAAIWRNTAINLGGTCYIICFCSYPIDVFIPVLFFFFLLFVCFFLWLFCFVFKKLKAICTRILPSGNLTVGQYPVISLPCSEREEKEKDAGKTWSAAQQVTETHLLAMRKHITWSTGKATSPAQGSDPAPIRPGIFLVQAQSLPSSPTSALWYCHLEERSGCQEMVLTSADCLTATKAPNTDPTLGMP